eukprot:TRINITY_DN1730_c0_g1_i2.p1 TRINITY_DN1730_c0_g1~~TRINITY_DN1730_c0_g1_i2.p1  ORF type:complete len:666 (+),score=115.62 TRINITY_DN1730_c0_g1_i2:398-2395(+)
MVLAAKEGWLSKRGGKVKNWKRRWFILQFGSLAYYNKEDSGNEPLGVIPLQGCKLERNAFAATKHNNSFTLTVLAGRTFLVQATNAEDAKEWQDALAEAIRVETTGTKEERRNSLKTDAQVLPRKGTVSRKELCGTFAKLRSGSTRKAIPFGMDEGEGPATKIFGVSLSDLGLRDGATLVPRCVGDMINFLQVRAYLLQGIFRLSGRADDVQRLRRSYDADEKVDLTQEEDAHAVAGLLKLFFRRLPEPLCPFDKYGDIMQVYLEHGTDRDEEIAQRISDIVGTWPERNQHILYRLVTLLHHIDSFSERNQMSADNLAIVFAPNLFRLQHSDPQQDMRDSPGINSITAIIISQIDIVFQGQSMRATYAEMTPTTVPTGRLEVSSPRQDPAPSDPRKLEFKRTSGREQSGSLQIGGRRPTFTMGGQRGSRQPEPVVTGATTTTTTATATATATATPATTTTASGRQYKSRGVRAEGGGSAAALSPPRSPEVQSVRRGFLASPHRRSAAPAAEPPKEVTPKEKTPKEETKEELDAAELFWLQQQQSYQVEEAKRQAIEKVEAEPVFDTDTPEGRDAKRIHEVEMLRSQVRLKRDVKRASGDCGSLGGAGAGVRGSFFGGSRAAAAGTPPANDGSGGSGEDRGGRRNTHRFSVMTRVDKFLAELDLDG